MGKTEDLRKLKDELSQRFTDSVERLAKIGWAVYYYIVHKNQVHYNLNFANAIQTVLFVNNAVQAYERIEDDTEKNRLYLDMLGLLSAMSIQYSAVKFLQDDVTGVGIASSLNQEEQLYWREKVIDLRNDIAAHPVYRNKKKILSRSNLTLHWELKKDLLVFISYYYGAGGASEERRINILSLIAVHRSFVAREFRCYAY